MHATRRLDGDLDRNVSDFADDRTATIAARAGALAEWRERRLRSGLWTWGRSLDGTPGARVTMRDEAGIARHGLNFATPDPLSLTAHPAIHDAATLALRRFGPHAPGPSALAGANASNGALEAAIAALVGFEHVVLFPSGWSASFGALTALVRADDHVVIDAAAHPALRAGAEAATRLVHRYTHDDLDDAATRLRAIRATDPRATILVVTESVFPFEARCPHLGALRAACHAYGAAVLVAVGWDLGVVGPRGAGLLGAAEVAGDVHFVVGSLAKTFAANGGFFATRSADLQQLVRFRASTHLSSNALSPIDVAVATEAIGIARSGEGDELRANLWRAADTLRRACARHDLACTSDVPAMAQIAIGSERVARLAEAYAAARSVLVSLVEDPLVPASRARLLLHVTATHRPEHAVEAAATIADAIARARAESA